MIIVVSEPEDDEINSLVLIIRLGGLHTCIQMSFLCSIGNLMAGSGLEDVLQLAYAENTVPHMPSGKAIARALRGHFLVDAALNTMIASSALNIPLLLLPDGKPADPQQ